MTNEETLSDWLRQQCGHDSRSVPECGHCEAADELERLSRPRPQSSTDSVATLRLLAKCGSMDLSMLAPIADEMERLANDRAIEQLHAAVKTAQELAATRLAEIERLRKQLTDCEKLLAAHDPKRECGYWMRTLPPEPLPSRTDHAENLAKALEHYLKAHDTLSAVQDTDEVSGTNEASDCGLHDAANDAWRAMRTALYEYRKHTKKS